MAKHNCEGITAASLCEIYDQDGRFPEPAPLSRRRFCASPPPKLRLFCGAVYAPVLRKTYFHVEEKRTWADARTQCRDKGRDLASINSHSEAVALQKILGAKRTSPSPWVGANRDMKSGKFKWLNGEFVSTTVHPAKSAAANCIRIATDTTRNAKPIYWAPKPIYWAWGGQAGCRSKTSFLCEVYNRDSKA